MTSFIRFPHFFSSALLSGCLIVGLFFTRLSAQTIHTIAGNGISENSGNGGPATSAGLSGPRGLALDAQGNLFISGVSQIRKVTTDGIIRAAVGDGELGFSGDGGPAINAHLSVVDDIAIDAQGNLFLSDNWNNRIRKVTPDGIINTVVGNGVRCSKETGCFGGDGGPAIQASLDGPTGIDIDAQGNLFIADYFNHRIRKVTPDGIITTVAGNGSYGFSGDGGPATSARLNFPGDVAVDAQGNLFIADQYNHRIRKVTPQGVITTWAGNGISDFGGDGGAATRASLDYPSGILLDAKGNLLIADGGNHRIRQVTPDGIISTIAGNGLAGFSGDGGLPTQASLNGPSSIAVDVQGNLYISDRNNYRVRKVTPAAVPLTVFSVSLINAHTDGPIRELMPGEEINLAGLPTQNLNLRANTAPATVGSVVMQLSGTQSLTQIENAAPYALFQDNNGDYKGWKPAVGSYTLTATPYTGPNGTGSAGTPYTFSFTVVDHLNVESFSLINAITQQTIQELTDGQELNLASLPSHVFNIQANTNPATVGSVVMQLSGTQTRTQLENTAPYALFKDGNGQYRTWKPVPGSYTLTATPYTGPNGTGSAGTPLTVSFQFVAPAAARWGADVALEPGAIRVFPNPFRESFTIQFQGPQAVGQPVRLYDLWGRLVWQETSERTEPQITLHPGLNNGVYVLQVGTGPAAKRHKLVKVP
ncbi:putative secreted protein (Por secretion system target) [Larkinella arboricola]|uniref:Putative secreted protein (Por secretion system target) n=1 Tax=Larkinella arboricola TaxID=643671 RepID=A0A327WNZ6_LARAB|nr:T9SS type A sorting domain-containing protein [Larkinella arboricola]RAJ92252.1 putative secreted protein (Por secretion system target) [Larkinella arboricola]